MQKRTLGRTGLELSRLGYGAIKLPRVSEDEAAALLNRAIDLGVNFIDTAHACGDSEPKIGRVMAKRRDEVYLASKVIRRTRAEAEEDVATSLKLLQTDHIDLYQIHDLSVWESSEQATGPDGAIREASPALHRELAGDPVGRPLDSVLTAGEDGGHRLAAGNGSGIPVEVEEAPAPDGGRILLLWPRRGPSATPLEERLRRTIARNLEEMDELSRRLEEMDNERARFLAWSAHELKTPLTVIQSHLEILLEDLAEGLSHEQMEFLRIAHDATRRMRRMVLDLTDLAALQSGRMHLEIQRVSLEDTMAGVTRDLEPAARGAGVTLTRRPTRLQVRGDRVRLEQILHNLLDNAIRFTPEGGRVELSATREGERAAIRVSDTGVGIPPDQLETVFEPFVQAGRPPEGRAKGSGLGLFVCRRIALALGGRIEAAARPAGGTVFTLWLPLWPEEEPSR